MTHAVRRGRPRIDRSSIAAEIARLRQDGAPWKVISAMLGASPRWLQYTLDEFTSHLRCGQRPFDAHHTVPSDTPRHQGLDHVMGLFSSPSPQPVAAAPPAAPSANDPAVEAARRKQITSAAAASGMSSTVLTGASGDQSNVMTRGASLLGGT